MFVSPRSWTRAGRAPYSFSAALLEPVRVVRVAQIASRSVRKAVDAALPITPLYLLTSFERLSILTTGAPFKVLTCVRQGRKLGQVPEHLEDSAYLGRIPAVYRSWTVQGAHYLLFEHLEHHGVEHHGLSLL